MPTAPLRPCAASGCPTLVHHGRCPIHARQQEQYRGTAHQRGYTSRDWQPFRRRFLAALVEANVVPVCGAALPDGPRSRDSQCRDDGVFTYTSRDGSSLHLDHEPPLADWERRNPVIVCDVTRIQLLCAQCHQRKTAREGGGSQKISG
jgi:hypothetical protein